MGGRRLRAGPVAVTELRGHDHRRGSASFEMMRALVEKLPLMLCPRWVKTRSQPIAIGEMCWHTWSAVLGVRGHAGPSL